MKKLKLLIIILSYPFLGMAWNGTGHSMGGAIAYYYLKSNNPSVIPKIINTLQKHPWYGTAKWNDKLAGLTGEQRNVALFMLASTFPDDARMVTGLGGPTKAKWHYVDYPFVPAGQTVTGAPPQTPNAEGKINELLNTLKTEAETPQKAIDVCWLFHLIEDVHQPLHTIALFDADHPTGDRGGNDTYISFTTSTSAVKLHSYWDGLIKGTFTNIPAKAQALLSNPNYSISHLTELTSGTTVNDWIKKESFSQAKDKAYKNGQVKGTETNPTTTPGNYAQDAGKVAERRIVLAGIRLAKKLKDLYP